MTFILRSFKYFQPLLFITISYHTLNAQSVSPEIISSGGSYQTSSQGSLSFTIGEAIGVSTYINTTIDRTLTQGFQQPELLALIPVKIISFTGEKRSEDVILRWVVSNEREIKTYSVERSFDAVSFTNIYTSPSFNDGSIRRTYTHIDSSKHSSEQLYYRIKISEISGFEWYTWVVKIKNISNSIRIYPIPTASFAIVEFKSAFTENKELLLLDVSGKVIQRKSIFIQRGLNIISFDLSNASKGLYFIKGLNQTNLIVIKN